MSNRPSGMKTCENLGPWLKSALVLAPLLVLCVTCIDVPVAYFVKNHLYVNRHWSRLTSQLPDLLLLVVLFSTAASWLLYKARSRRGIFDATTRLAKTVIWVAPASYLVKAVLKFVFGRVNTRMWLQAPELYGFHWFEGRQGCEGFPSGHMIVIVALLAALWRCHPKSRPLSLVVGLLLGLALVATDYHFVSDVIAGAYVGVLVEAVACRLLPGELKKPEHSPLQQV